MLNLIVDYINKFFVIIGQKLVEALPKLDDLYSAFSANCNTFYNNKGVTPGMYMYTLQEIDEAFESEIKKFQIAPRTLR